MQWRASWWTLIGVVAVAQCGGQTTGHRADIGADAGNGGNPAIVTPDARALDAATAPDGSALDSSTCASCEPLWIGSYRVEACCASDGTCGLDPALVDLIHSPVPSECIRLNQPGELDGTCPTVADGGVLGFRLPGCCRPDGSCGVYIDILNMGTVGCTDGAPWGYPGSATCGGATCPMEPCDCPDGRARTRMCLPDGTLGSCLCLDNCYDGSSWGYETDVDCGGPCEPCGDGLRCSVHEDCTSGMCEGELCRPLHCADGSLNENESDLDCGGACSGCALGLNCTEHADCADRRCVGRECVETTCENSVVDGDESDVDCGGPSCPACDRGGACRADSDCADNWCAGGQCTQFE